MDIERMIEGLGQTMQKEGTVKAVFGDPIKLDNHTVVPVAVIAIDMGGGGAGITLPFGKGDDKASKPVGGGGGGLSIHATPVGFIYERDGDVVYSAIDLPNAHAKASMVSDVAARVLGKLGKGRPADPGPTATR